MSLINDMLHDKQRRQKGAKTASLGARPLEMPNNDASKRTPPDSGSYLHGKFDSMVMYNPYAKGEQPGVQQQIQGSLVARYGLMIGGGMCLAAIIHWAVIPSKSLIGQLIQNDPFYATGSAAWNKAYGLFQPTVPPVLVETSTVNPTPQPFLARKPVIKAAAVPGTYQAPVAQEKTSQASQWLSSRVGILMSNETVQNAFPNNTPEADALKTLAAANGSLSTSDEAGSGIKLSKDSPRAIEREMNVALSDADNYIRIGAVQEAINLLQGKIAKYPSQMKLRIALATFLIEQKNYAEAEKVINIGQQLDPSHAGLRRVEAQWNLAQNNVNKAIELLLISPPQLQEAPEYYSVLAAAYQRAGKHDMAAQLYTDLLQFYPESARWWAALGVSLEAGNAFQLSVNSYMKALTIGGLEPELRNFVSKRVKQLGAKGNLAIGEGHNFNLTR